MITELTLLLIQLQEIVRNRSHMYVYMRLVSKYVCMYVFKYGYEYETHIRSHTRLPGPLTQGKDEPDQLLIGNVLEASEFH